MLTIDRHGSIQHRVAVRVWDSIRATGTVATTPGDHLAAAGTLLVHKS